MKPIILRLCAVTLACVALPALVWAEPGQMQHVTTTMKMQMANMPMTMSPHTIETTVCVGKQHDMRDIIHQANAEHRHSDCSFSDFKVTGTSGSFHYACAGQMPMAGTGTFAGKAGGVSHATIEMHTTGGNQPMAMTMTFDSTPTGAACDYTPPAADK